MIRRTPIARDAELGIALKLENLQRTGSFKLRGATRAVRALDAGRRAAGVVAASAGNHGAGLALAAREAGIEATVVVPELAPANKRERIAALGAHVLVRGAVYDEAKVHALALAGEMGSTYVSAYDDEDIIEGNGGDLGREIRQQVLDLARVIVPVGGGGMIAGLARTLCPDGIDVFGVQPAANCAMHDSLAAGKALTSYDGGETLAEGCEGAVVERTYRIVAEHGVAIGLVSEDAIRSAIRYCFERHGQVVEASAAVAVAGLREGAVVPSDRGTTVVVVSGGNIEPGLLDEILAG